MSDELDKAQAWMDAIAAGNVENVAVKDTSDLSQVALLSDRGHEIQAQLTAAVVDSPTTFVHGLHADFPWMTFLSEGEQQQLADELVSLARGCAAVDRFEPLAAAVQGWEATAQAYAAGIPRDGADIDWLAGEPGRC